MFTRSSRQNRQTAETRIDLSIDLDGEGDSAHHRLTAANQRIQQMLRHDTGLQGIYDELESARIAISEAVSDLNNYVSRVDLDPRRLADVEARLSAVFETARKFRTEPEALCALRDSLHAELSALQAAAVHPRTR